VNDCCQSDSFSLVAVARGTRATRDLTISPEERSNYTSHEVQPYSGLRIFRLLVNPSASYVSPAQPVNEHPHFSQAEDPRLLHEEGYPY
jgi:hypothetical protein